VVVDVDLLEGLRRTREDKRGQWYQNMEATNEARPEPCGPKCRWNHSRTYAVYPKLPHAFCER
jgi:hypothetical protein